MSEVLPYYLSLGLEKAFIDGSCPKELKPYDDAHKVRMMEIDMLNWYNGMYTLNAVAVALDKAFGGNAEYADEPILSELNLTEEQKYEKKLRKALAAEAKWAAQASYLPDNV